MSLIKKIMTVYDLGLRSYHVHGSSKIALPVACMKTRRYKLLQRGRQRSFIEPVFILINTMILKMTI